MLPSDFLADFHSRSTALICLCSLSNERGGKPTQIYTRDPVEIDKFVATHDRPGRAVYFGCATYPRGKDRRKDHIAEIIGAHTDLDFKGIAATRTEIEAVLARLELRPAFVVFSGHGLHAYWLFAVCTTDIARVEKLLKRLAWALAGDEAVTEAARIMRLPGSHNTKFGEWIDVEVVQRNDVAYSLEQLETWLDGLHQPLLPRVSKEPRSKPAGGLDPFERVADAQIISEPLDVEAALARMRFGGTEGNGVNDTQWAVIGSLI